MGKANDSADRDKKTISSVLGEVKSILMKILFNDSFRDISTSLFSFNVRFTFHSLEGK